MRLEGQRTYGACANNYYLEFLLDVAYCTIEISIQDSNYPGIILVSPAGAGEGGSEGTSRSGQGTASPGTPCWGVTHDKQRR